MIELVAVGLSPVFFGLGLVPFELDLVSVDFGFFDPACWLVSRGESADGRVDSKICWIFRRLDVLVRQPVENDGQVLDDDSIWAFAFAMSSWRPVWRY